MATKIPNIEFPELVFGFVGAIGVDLNPTIATFDAFFKSHDYNVVPIRVTDLYELLQKAVPPKILLVKSPEKNRYKASIAYGNQLREHFEDDSTLYPDS